MEFHNDFARLDRLHFFGCCWYFCVAEIPFAYFWDFFTSCAKFNWINKNAFEMCCDMDKDIWGIFGCIHCRRHHYHLSIFPQWTSTLSLCRLFAILSSIAFLLVKKQFAGSLHNFSFETRVTIVMTWRMNKCTAKQKTLFHQRMPKGDLPTE